MSVHMRFAEPQSHLRCHKPHSVHMHLCTTLLISSIVVCLGFLTLEEPSVKKTATKKSGRVYMAAVCATRNQSLVAQSVPSITTENPVIFSFAWGSFGKHYCLVWFLKWLKKETKHERDIKIDRCIKSNTEILQSRQERTGLAQLYEENITVFVYLTLTFHSVQLWNILR